MNVFNTDGWSKPIYTDDWGNIISEEDKSRMDREKEIKRFILQKLKEVDDMDKATRTLNSIGTEPVTKVYFTWECDKCGAFGTGFIFECPYCKNRKTKSVCKKEGDNNVS